MSRSEPCDSSSLQIKTESSSLCSEAVPELTMCVPGGRAEPLHGGRSLGWKGQCRRLGALCLRLQPHDHICTRAWRPVLRRAWPRPGREPDQGQQLSLFLGKRPFSLRKACGRPGAARGGLPTSKQSGASGTGDGTGPEVLPGCWGRLPPALGSPGAFKSPGPALLSLKEGF